MQITCDCLNIIISSSANDFSSDESSRERYPNYSFFKEDVALLCLCSVTVQVPSLVKERVSGDWKIVSCLNCGQACYSTNKKLALNSLIVKINLEKESSQVNALKQSEIYSPAFKILLYDDLPLESDYDSDDVSLYPAALTWLSEQTAKTEERIKIFAEKEFNILDTMRKRAYRDQIAILRKEKDLLKEKSRKDSFEELTESLKLASLSESLKKSTDQLFTDDPSMDSEGVFLLEEFESKDDEKKLDESDLEDSDNENDSYVSRKQGISQLAKSLPIPVPQFMEDRRPNDPDRGSPEVPSDIAASIKALAKSVHGDAIFGELPRPRFSTHL
ncbi:uncharacterized protein [Halyomorpha halys]|uniref:uncharacterized protein n=1 Tax=Halyomorpha halys TaxID=286706 RepID=UPI0006D4D61A|nr:uncharacterized protein LOC106685370 [Halyomorpha halys]XP_014283482.1 uncharacterized protein LOC106685370 [Halyomorpha halys]